MKTIEVFDAVVSGNLETLKKAKEEGFDFNKRSDYDTSQISVTIPPAPIELAVAFDQLESLIFLLKEVNTKLSDLYSLAIRNHSIYCLEYFLSEFNFEIDEYCLRCFVEAGEFSLFKKWSKRFKGIIETDDLLSSLSLLKDSALRQKFFEYFLEKNLLRREELSKKMDAHLEHLMAKFAGLGDFNIAEYTLTRDLKFWTKHFYTVPYVVEMKRTRQFENCLEFAKKHPETVKNSAELLEAAARAYDLEAIKVFYELGACPDHKKKFWKRIVDGEIPIKEVCKKSSFSLASKILDRLLADVYYGLESKLDDIIELKNCIKEMRNSKVFNAKEFMHIVRTIRFLAEKTEAGSPERDFFREAQGEPPTLLSSIIAVLK